MRALPRGGSGGSPASRWLTRGVSRRPPAPRWSSKAAGREGGRKGDADTRDAPSRPPPPPLLSHRSPPRASRRSAGPGGGERGAREAVGGSRADRWKGRAWNGVAVAGGRGGSGNASARRREGRAPWGEGAYLRRSLAQLRGRQLPRRPLIPAPQPTAPQRSPRPAPAPSFTCRDAPASLPPSLPSPSPVGAASGPSSAVPPRPAVGAEAAGGGLGGEGRGVGCTTPMPKHWPCVPEGLPWPGRVRFKSATHRSALSGPCVRWKLWVVSRAVLAAVLSSAGIKVGEPRRTWLGRVGFYLTDTRVCHRSLPGRRGGRDKAGRNAPERGEGRLRVSCVHGEVGGGTDSGLGGAAAGWPAPGWGRHSGGLQPGWCGCRLALREAAGVPQCPAAELVWVRNTLGRRQPCWLDAGLPLHSTSCFIQVFPIRMVARLHYAEAYLYPQEMLHGWKGIFKCSERWLLKFGKMKFTSFTSFSRVKC